MITYKRFEEILKNKIFDSSKPDLLYKIATSPNRYIGLFRPTTVTNKLIQNISQSHEIRFGDAFELIIREIIKDYGYSLLSNEISYGDKKFSCDQHFRDNQGRYYLIEQKIRDDHDSSKKEGQIVNFEGKIDILSKKYGFENLTAIFYFIDPSFTKNRRYYKDELGRIENDYNVSCKLFYGSEMFEYIFEDGNNIWQNIEKYLEKWRKNIPDFPEINYDKDAELSFREIEKALEGNTKSDFTRAKFNNLLSNVEIVEAIFPIIFPEKTTLAKLLEYTNRKYEHTHERIYQTIYMKLEKAMKSY